jgi:hypothetical protein
MNRAFECSWYSMFRLIQVTPRNEYIEGVLKTSTLLECELQFEESENEGNMLTYLRLLLWTCLYRELQSDTKGIPATASQSEEHVLVLAAIGSNVRSIWEHGFEL